MIFSQFCFINGNVIITNHASGIWLLDCSILAINWKNDNDVTIDVAVIFLSSLIFGSSFMPISLLVLELWQFSYTKDWAETPKSQLTLCEFCLIPGDWGKLQMSNLTRMCLVKSYWILKNTRVTALTVFTLLRENQQGWRYPHPD